MIERLEAQKNYIVELELIKLVREIHDEIKKSKIKINSATLDELTNVTGIGKSTASKIIDLREKHGSFKSFDDLLSKLKRINTKGTEKSGRRLLYLIRNERLKDLKT
jgi:competence ComEA-like helix-hairpin-helix protein